MSFNDIQLDSFVKIVANNEWYERTGIVSEIDADTVHIFCVQYPSSTYKIIKGYNESDIELL